MPELLVERTHYDVLGVGRYALPEEIWDAFEEIVQTIHPSGKYYGSRVIDEDLGEVTKAYNTLHDPEKRAKYDEAISNPFEELCRRSGIDPESQMIERYFMRVFQSRN